MVHGATRGQRFINERIDAFAKKKLKAEANDCSDRSACFVAFTNKGRSHTVTISGGGKKSVQNSFLPLQKNLWAVFGSGSAPRA